MFDVQRQKMYRWRIPNERVVICGTLYENKADPNFIFMAYANLNDDNNNELYAGDVCELTLQNEFGSFTKQIATMAFVFNPYFGLHFVLKDQSMFNGNVVSVKLLGNMCETPDIIKDVKPQYDHQSIERSNGGNNQGDSGAA